MFKQAMLLAYANKKYVLLTNIEILSIPLNPYILEIEEYWLLPGYY